MRAGWRPRALSTATAAVVMAVVVIIAGVAAYVAGGLGAGGTQSHTSCAPPTSSACAAIATTHDISLLVPFRSTQTGTTVPFTALLPTGESSTSFKFDFGDGSTPTTSSSASTDHVYTNPGTYIASVQATVGGGTHDNYQSLVVIEVTTSFAQASQGNLPSVTGTIVSNSSSKAAPSAVIQPGQGVQVTGTYTAAPTNPAWSLQPAKIVSSGGAVGAPATTPSSVTATVTFANSGVSTITFAGSAKSGASIVYSNYTWTVFVAPAGVHAGLPKGLTKASPHPGIIVSYENTPGGTYTSDPAIDYDIVGFEILINVYQTLVFYNGSQTGTSPGNFVPQLATCVPGSPECQSLYGNTLIQGSNWTFVVDHNAQFYDPNTGNHWGVYPSDVLFSVARTMAFANLPCVGCNNGWILTQALLSPGSSWDNAIHQAYNNTPFNVLNSVSVNDSRWCPSAAMTQDHGCVTFHVNGGGVNWPYFLELIGDNEGASIVPCGWFSSTSANGGAAGIPYWTAAPSPSTPITGTGDHPCLLPGGATSTNSTQFQNAIRMIPITGWDSWENQCSTVYCGNVQFSLVGSGPYYLSKANYKIGAAYTLHANPDYAANPHCTWVTCQPAPGQFAKTVQVVWETSASQGEQAMASGIADYAGIPVTDFALMLQLVQQGKAISLSIPTINVYFFPLVLNFDPAGAQRFSSNPVNVPGDWFSNLAVRQFFVHAYPYATVQSSVNTRDGIQTGFPYGGAIPQFMNPYYPTNISWPTGDPCTDSSNVACASFWWHQLVTPSSAYYSAWIAANCKASSPCQFPIFGVTGDPDTDQRLALWGSEISTLSGGAVKVNPVDLIESDLVTGQFDSPGTSPLTAYSIRWVPDYPDPTDYVRPFYNPDNVFTFSAAVAEQLGNTSLGFNSTTCHSDTDFAFWARQTSIPENCQGSAYWAMNAAFAAAGPLPGGSPQRILLYNMGEHIANLLALYVYVYQQNLVPTLAPWIDPGSFNANPVIGAGGDTPWFWITGNNVQFSGST